MIFVFNLFQPTESKIRAVLTRANAATNNQSCTSLLAGDAALVMCNSSGIIDLTSLVNLCIDDYNMEPVKYQI